MSAVAAEWPPSQWLLLRGLGREARHWGTFTTVLAASLGAQAHAVDLPGVGARADCRVPRCVRATARELERSLNPDDVGRTFGVVGLSLGGMVALALAEAFPDRVKALVLINTSSGLSPWCQRMTSAGAAALLRSMLTMDPVDREVRIHELTTNAASDQVRIWARQAAAIARRCPVRRRVVIRQLIAAARFTPRSVPQPILILSAHRDRLVSPACSQALASYLSACHEQHPSAGHDLPLEAPDWVVDRIRAWLALSRTGTSAGAPRA